MLEHQKRPGSIRLEDRSWAATAANLDKVRQTNRAYRDANREQVRAQQRKYQAAKRARAKERGDPDATGSRTMG